MAISAAARACTIITRPADRIIGAQYKMTQTLSGEKAHSSDRRPYLCLREKQGLSKTTDGRESRLCSGIGAKVLLLELLESEERERFRWLRACAEGPLPFQDPWPGNGRQSEELLPRS